jgi:hypothetical protein
MMGTMATNRELGGILHSKNLAGPSVKLATRKDVPVGSSGRVQFAAMNVRADGDAPRSA